MGMLNIMTLSKILSVSFVLLSMAACSATPSDENTRSNLTRIQDLLPGDYIGSTGGGDVYHSIVHLQVPKFGGDVFYHHISLQSLHGPAAFQKIYVFDESSKRMKSTVVLGRGQVFIDKETMVRRLNDLTEAELLRFPDGCQFQWAASADGFVAEVGRRKCSYDSPAFGGAVSPQVEYQLTRCSLSITEGIFREDGSSVIPLSTTYNRRVSPIAERC